MSVAAPGWLLAAGLVGLAVTALHFLARRQPRAAVFPTARFIPDRPVSAPAPTRRPHHLLLLAWRLATVACLGLGLAGPTVTRPPRHLTIVAMDRSRAAASVPDSLIGMATRADAVLAFDSSWTTIPPDSAAAAGRSAATGSLSVALLAAMRKARELGARSRDTLELILASPLADEEWDPATPLIRARWPGKVRLVQLPMVAPDSGSPVLTGPPDDPLRATLALAGAAGAARVVRGPLASRDSADARAGAVVVHWPVDPGQAGWTVRTPDTMPGVATGDHVVAAPFVRVADPPPGQVIAAWIDGTPAATQQAMGAGCVRSVAIPVVDTGDIVIRTSFLEMTRRLVAPCGGPVSRRPLDQRRLDSLTGDSTVMESRLLRAGSSPRTAPLWLAGALALFGLEPLIRRRTG